MISSSFHLIRLNIMDRQNRMMRYLNFFRRPPDKERLFLLISSIHHFFYSFILIQIPRFRKCTLCFDSSFSPSLGCSSFIVMDGCMGPSPAESSCLFSPSFVSLSQTFLLDGGRLEVTGLPEKERKTRRGRGTVAGALQKSSPSVLPVLSVPDRIISET